MSILVGYYKNNGGGGFILQEFYTLRRHFVLFFFSKIFYNDFEVNYIICFYTTPTGVQFTRDYLRDIELTKLLSFNLDFIPLRLTISLTPVSYVSKRE